MKIKRYIVALFFSLAFMNMSAYSQDTTSNYISKLIYSSVGTLKTCQPGFNFISHDPDENDDKIYKSHQYLIGQLPSEKNYKNYYQLACALWNLNKIKQAEKMFLNIINSNIINYTSSYYHNSDIPGDTATNLYGYGSFTSNYKNYACIYLSKIYIEQKNFQTALSYLNQAVKTYKVTYTCGTGYRAQKNEYDFLYASCYKGLGQNRKVIEMLLPEFLDWDNPILTGAIKKLYTNDEIKKYLAEGERSIKCKVDNFLSYSYQTTNYGKKDEKVDTLKYYSGTGTIMIFGKKLDLPRPYLKDRETLTRDYYVRLFKESSFFRQLNDKEEIAE